MAQPAIGLHFTEGTFPLRPGEDHGEREAVLVVHQPKRTQAKAAPLNYSI